MDILLLDKTGTITFGNRAASGFYPVPGTDERTLAEAAVLSSLGDETPEGRSILAFARDRHNVVPNEPAGATVVPFSANTRLSGLDAEGHAWRKGAVDSVLKLVPGSPPQAFTMAVERISRAGSTPLGVCVDGRLLGAIELKDIVKPGIRARFDALRKMGIRTVMVTGDNRITAAAIATESGVDDFIAEAKPQDKLDYIRERQAEGRLVAMAGRRHQRRAGAGPGRRGGRDADRHAGGARSGQHGRSG